MLAGYAQGTPIVVTGYVQEILTDIGGGNYTIVTTQSNPYALPTYPTSGRTGIGGYPNLESGYYYESSRPYIIAVLTVTSDVVDPSDTYHGLTPQSAHIVSMFDLSGVATIANASQASWAFTGNMYGVVPENTKAGSNGLSTIEIPNNSGGYDVVETGLYTYSPNGINFVGTPYWPGTNTWYGVNLEYTAPASGAYVGTVISGTLNISWELKVYHYKGVYGDSPWPPDTSTNLQQLFGLSVDRMPFGLTRQAGNVNFTSTPINLIRYYDLDHTTDIVSTALSGYSPAIRCLNNGNHLVCYSDGTNIVAKIVDDNGSVLTTMASPGTGKLNSQAVVDKTGVIWIAICDNDTGTAATITVKRSLDGGAHWDSVGGATLPSAGSLDAQAPQLVGDIADLQLWYHDGGNIYGMRSRDSGETWGAI